MDSPCAMQIADAYVLRWLRRPAAAVCAQQGEARSAANPLHLRWALVHWPPALYVHLLGQGEEVLLDMERKVKEVVTARIMRLRAEARRSAGSSVSGSSSSSSGASGSGDRGASHGTRHLSWTYLESSF